MDTKPLSLSARLDQLHSQYGDMVPLADIGEIAQSLLTTVDGDVTSGELRARHEVVDLLKFLRDARAEIANIRPNRLTQRDIPAATDELDAVIKATETATHSILSAAETLSALIPDLTNGASEIVGQVVTDIYEASTFQDISGQRISKVVRTLRQIEERLTRLAEALGVAPELEPADDETPADDPKSMLAGPQMPATANNQDDIDALFDSF